MLRCCRPVLWSGLLAVLAPTAQAGDPRDIVFECPCRAEWTAGEEGEAGTLALTFGVRSFRGTESGELRLAEVDPERLAGPHASEGPSLGRFAAGAVRSRERVDVPHGQGDVGQPIGVRLWEKVAEAPSWRQWHPVETLVLWPMGDVGGEVVEFVDMLTDTDGDGISDVNEALAGTSPTDPAARPGESTIDLLALYNSGFREALDGYPYTRMHHVVALTSAVFRDSGTNLRFRMVGAREVALGDTGAPDPGEVSELLDRHGADLSFRFHMGQAEMGCPPGAGGCALLGGAVKRGLLPASQFLRSVCRGTNSALCAAHELGHNLGLAHSDRQGEAHGAFRWSRGRYVTETHGTVMSYGFRIGAFSDPAADCGGVPCGVPIDQAAGAHAARSLDLVRFQAAARRAPAPDADGDGIVDEADALPDDPTEWVDFDGDGIGDNADPDDDGDGVADTHDAFPHDAAEWEDADQDGVGDNADDEVTDLSPFRDVALRAAVEQALGKEAGAPITADDLSTLTSLSALSGNIRNLHGLELASNLESLYVWNNEIEDVAPLAGLARLSRLGLQRNRIVDVSPIAGMAGLRYLWLTDNPLPDLSALAEFGQLQGLYVGNDDREVPGASALGELTNLRTLSAINLGIADLSVLSGLAQLQILAVRDNPVTDLSPLRDLTRVFSLDVAGTGVVDLSPLSNHRLTTLRIGRTALTLENVRALPRFGELRTLGLRELALEDVSALSRFPGLESVDLRDNRVRDLSALAELAGLRWLNLRNNDVAELGSLAGLSELATLDLVNNRVADIGPLGGPFRLRWLALSNNNISDMAPLVRREAWNLDASVITLLAYGNPLDDRSHDEHIPTLKSWGITVHAPARAPADDPGSLVSVPDPELQGLVSQAIARASVQVDDPITEESIVRLRSLRGFNAGVADLSGLQAASELERLFLGANLVSDLTPLADLGKLNAIDLTDNLVADLTPLVENANIDNGDWVTLTGNPLSEESLNVHVPALLDRGVDVGVDSVRLPVSPDIRATTFDVSGYFEATAGAGAELALAGDAADGIESALEDGRLLVSLGAVAGPTSVNVTATNSDGNTETLAFEILVRQVVALFPSAATTAYQGFVRVTNHSPKRGRAVIHATDDEGQRHGPVTLSLDAHATAPFNSQDLEHGNAAKGLSDGVGAGTGDWRLDFGSNLDIEVLGYARTADGFVTTLHELAPRTGDDRTLPFLNPGSNTAQVSRLRLVNRGAEDAEVGVTGVDDRGRSPGGAVRFSVAAHTARTLTAAELEAGEGGTGSLGDGAGKWRLVVESPDPVYAMSLLESPTGHLTNLSSGPVRAADGTHSVPLFPAAGDPDGRQGFVRVVNRADRAGTVTIAAIDDAGQHHGSATLALSAGATAPFNSNDLEQGNPDKGLTDGVGAGTGDWRLALTADVAVDVFAYVRHADGFVTSMHDAAPGPAAPVAGAPLRDTHHRIGFLNPGSNRAQVSSLRLINPGTASAEVTITGRDDRGRSPGDTVRVTVPAGAARTYTAAQLEEGGTGLRGALGDGAGKWRLTVDSSAPILVMSLLASPTGHLSNLSTAPSR